MKCFIVSLLVRDMYNEWIFNGDDEYLELMADRKNNIDKIQNGNIIRRIGEY